MEEILLRSLISRQHVTASTEVDVEYSTLMVGNVQKFDTVGTFTVTAIGEKRSDGTLLMEGRSTRDGRKIKFTADRIRNIDGMTPLRFAENYMVAPDGTDIPVTGARRGRRPKNWTGD